MKLIPAVNCIVFILFFSDIVFNVHSIILHRVHGRARNLILILEVMVFINAWFYGCVDFELSKNNGCFKINIKIGEEMRDQDSILFLVVDIISSKCFLFQNTSIFIHFKFMSMKPTVL